MFNSSAMAHSDVVACSFEVFVNRLFIVMLVLCSAVMYVKHKSKLESLKNADLAFRKFQLRYIAIFLCAVMADWLKGPYIYVLYQDAGFTKGDIAILYMAGYGTKQALNLSS